MIKGKALIIGSYKLTNVPGGAWPTQEVTVGLLTNDMIHRKRERGRERQRDRDRDRHIHTQRERETEIAE